MSELIYGEEMVALTGTPQKSLQVEYLATKKIPFSVRRDGYPVTTHTAYNNFLMRAQSHGSPTQEPRRLVTPKSIQA